MGITHQDVANVLGSLDSLSSVLLKRKMMEDEKEKDMAARLLQQQILGLRQKEADAQGKRYDQATEHEKRMEDSESQRIQAIKDASDRRSRDAADEEKGRRDAADRALTVKAFENTRDYLAKNVKDGVMTPEVASQAFQNILARTPPEKLAHLAGTGLDVDLSAGFKLPKQPTDFGKKTVTTKDPATGSETTVTRNLTEADLNAPGPDKLDQLLQDAQNAVWEAKANERPTDSKTVDARKSAEARLQAVQAMRLDRDKSTYYTKDPITGALVKHGGDPTPAAASAATAPVDPMAKYGSQGTIDLGEGRTAQVPKFTWDQLPEAQALVKQISDIDTQYQRLGTTPPTQVSTQIPSFGTGMGIPGTGMHLTDQATPQDQLKWTQTITKLAADRKRLTDQLNAWKAKFPK